VFKATPTSPTQMQQSTLTSPGNAMIAQLMTNCKYIEGRKFLNKKVRRDNLRV
jgi:hypothetical protein